MNNRIEQKKNLSIIFGTMPWVTVRTIMIKFSRIIYVKLTLAKKEQKHISSHLLANMHIWYCNNRKQKINICMMFFLLLFFILLIMKLTLLRNQFKRKTTKKSTKALRLRSLAFTNFLVLRNPDKTLPWLWIITSQSRTDNQEPNAALNLNHTTQVYNLLH